jgi:hypothetical protein
MKPDCFVSYRGCKRHHGIVRYGLVKILHRAYTLGTAIDHDRLDITYITRIGNAE